jgi:HEPN domain-containing protein
MAAARVLFDAGLTDGACFHSQQAAEKCLKALLEEQGQHVPRTHDLDALSRITAQPIILLADGGARAPCHRLIERISNFVAVADEVREAATFLSSFGVEVRYPGTDSDLEDARESLQMANRIVNWMTSYVGE